MSATEQEVAAEMQQLLMQWDPEGSGLTLTHLCSAAQNKYSISLLKQVARQRPTEFAVFNKTVNKKSKQSVLSLLAAAKSVRFCLCGERLIV